MPLTSRAIGDASGLLTTPSGITIPALTTENNMLAVLMSLPVNGVGCVATKCILSGSLGWKNNLLLNAGSYPGSGLQNGLQVRRRMELGARVPSFQFTARLLECSPEDIQHARQPDDRHGGAQRPA